MPDSFRLAILEAFDAAAGSLGNAQELMGANEEEDGSTVPSEPATPMPAQG